MTFNTESVGRALEKTSNSFKPCYKWMTFNTKNMLNVKKESNLGFKPCYKWMTFNTVNYIAGEHPGCLF